MSGFALARVSHPPNNQEKNKSATANKIRTFTESLLVPYNAASVRPRRIVNKCQSHIPATGGSIYCVEESALAVIRCLEGEYICVAIKKPMI